MNIQKSFLDLPDEILYRIFVKLNYKDICMCMCTVNSVLANIISDHFWKYKFLNQYPYSDDSLEYKNYKEILRELESDTHIQRHLDVCIKYEVFSYAKYLVEKHNIPDLELEVSVICAVKYNRIEMLKYLLEHMKHKYYPITEACYYGNLDIILYLIDLGIDTYACLVECIKHNHLHIIKHFIEYNLIESIPEYFFELATISNSYDILVYLMEKQIISQQYKDKLLRHSVEKGNINIAKYLIETKHADLHSWNNTAIILAAKNGHVDLVKYLYEHGANINIKKNMPLKWAYKNNHWNIVSYLIVRVNKIFYPADYLIMAAKNEDLEIINLLKEYSTYSIEELESAILSTGNEQIKQILRNMM